MKLENKNILLISPEPWSTMMVSKHHYAEHLAKNNQVFFLNPPSESIGQINKKERLTILNYRPKTIGLKYLPAWLTALLIKYEIQSLERRINKTFDVVWNFDPSRFFNLSIIDALKICHIVDWNQKYQRSTLAKTADICFSTSTFLVTALGKYNSHSYFINHGYHESAIEEIPSLKLDSDKISVGYIGNLNIKYLDWNLILELVTSHLAVNFYFIGPYDIENGDPKMKVVYNHKNSYFLGKVDAHLIPSYLTKMDILLLAYKARQFPKQLANPHKMLEYLGSGKPIVSTLTEQYKPYNDLILLAGQDEDFICMFEQAIKDHNSKDKDNLSKRRISLAKSNSYDLQLLEIEKYLNATVS